MTVIDYKDILEILKNGFMYKNHEGNKIFIRFRECADNFEQHIIETENFPTIRVEKNQLDEFKCVGTISNNSDSLSIEFFCDPHIKVEFKKSWINWNPDKKFKEFNDKLNSFGWQTFDSEQKDEC